MPLAVGAARGVHYHPDSESTLAEQDHRRYDFSILALAFEPAGKTDDSRRVTRLTAASASAKRRLACVDLDALGPDALDGDELPRTAGLLAATCFESGLQVGNVPALLLCHHDSPWLASVGLGHAAGLVVENACILPSGERRDYFQAQPLRDAMARCAKERERRPDLFVSFLELWEHRPHPAVVRRAVKLAEHFGAVVEHGSVTPAARGAPSSTSSARTWPGCSAAGARSCARCGSRTGRRRRAPCRSAPASSTRWCRASLLLAREPLPPDLAALQAEEPLVFDPPDYAGLAPRRSDFWTASGDGGPLSPLGCYSLCTEPSPDDYAVVVVTQTHLKELDMLHLLKGVGAFRLLEAVRFLARQDAGGRLVQDLVDGLESHQVCVSRGLNTGFRVPEGDACFWGVTAGRDARNPLAVDVFVSQKAPSDATTVFHAWLAHRGVPRDMRFDLEVLLQAASGMGALGGLPLSIRAGLERATPAETPQLPAADAHGQAGPRPWPSPSRASATRCSSTRRRRPAGARR